MRTRQARRRIGAVALAASTAVVLSGCIAFATSRPAVDALREYALTLDGVSSVEMTTDDPANRANPLVTDSSGVALVTLDDDGWEASLEPVSEALVAWLATEHADPTTSLAVAIGFPVGAVALSDAETTSGRVELVRDALSDPHLVGIRIGWDSGYATSLGNLDTEVVLVRDAATTLSSVVTEWMPLLDQYEWLTVATPSARPEEATGVADASLGARELRIRDVPPDDAYLAWFDAIDRLDSVIGWTARDRAALVALSEGVDAAEAETLLRALPGYETLTSLTILHGDREYDVVG